MILETLFWFCILAASITVLVKCSDWFTESAEKIGLNFGLSPFVIGVTIVAIGTSLPELVSSIVAMFSGASEIVLGNALGSNVANVFLVLGFAGLFARNVKFKNDNLMFDFIYLIFSSLLIGAFLINGYFSKIEAIISVALLITYLIISLKSKNLETKTRKRPELSKKAYFILLLSGVGIYLGAKFVVSSVITLSDILGFPKEVISASIVAIGTSLPELSVSIAAARKGNIEVAVGNVLGSNIFNVLGVIGISGLFGAIAITGNILTFILPLMILASIVFVVVSFDKRIKLYEGILLLLFYGVFLVKLFI